MAGPCTATLIEGQRLESKIDELVNRWSKYDRWLLKLRLSDWKSNVGLIHQPAQAPMHWKWNRPVPGIYKSTPS